MAADTKFPSSAVVDASFVLARLLPDEKHTPKVASYFERFAQGKLKFLALQLLPHEVTNALRSAVLQRRLTLHVAKQLTQEFMKLPIEYHQIEFEPVLVLAIKHKLSVYDAAYVFLAEKRKLTLLSLDRRLVRLA